MYGIPVFEDKIKIVGGKWYVHLGQRQKKNDLLSEYKGILIAGSDSCPHCVNLASIIKKIDTSSDPALKPIKWLPYVFDIHMTAKAHEKSREMNIEYMPQLYIIDTDSSLVPVKLPTDKKIDENVIAETISETFKMKSKDE